MLRRLDERLVAPGPSYRLREVRALLAVVMGIRLATKDWTLLSERPASLTGGLSFLSWVPEPVPAPVVVALQVAGLVGVVLVVLNVRVRTAFLVTWLAYASLAALWGSSGKVMHNEVLTVTIAFVFLFAAAPGRREPASWAVRWGWPPRAALMVLATVYALTGLQKLRHSGPAWVFSDNMAWVLRQGHSPFLPEVARVVAQHDWLSRSLAGGAILLELTAPLWLAFRRTRGLFALGSVAMHGSVWLFLGLDYTAWAMTAIAVAVPMSLLPTRSLFPWRDRSDLLPSSDDVSERVVA